MAIHASNTLNVYLDASGAPARADDDRGVVQLVGDDQAPRTGKHRQHLLGESRIQGVGCGAAVELVANPIPGNRPRGGHRVVTGDFFVPKTTIGFLQQCAGSRVGLSGVSGGATVELVAKPMPKTHAACVPRNPAVRTSSSAGVLDTVRRVFNTRPDVSDTLACVQYV